MYVRKAAPFILSIVTVAFLNACGNVPTGNSGEAKPGYIVTFNVAATDTPQALEAKLCRSRAAQSGSSPGRSSKLTVLYCCSAVAQ